MLLQFVMHSRTISSTKRPVAKLPVVPRARLSSYPMEFPFVIGTTVRPLAVPPIVTPKVNVVPLVVKQLLSPFVRPILRVVRPV